VKIFRYFLLTLAVAAFVAVGPYGCAKKQEKGTGGIGTQQPADTTKGTDEGKERTQKEAPPTGSEVPEPVSVRPEKALVDVYFDFDKYDIKSGEAATLQKNAAWMKANPKYMVVIEGHCDERGTVEYNLALGERRSKAAMDYMVSLGIDASKMKTLSYGKSKPQDEGHDEAAWAKNRRAHFVVQQ